MVRTIFIAPIKNGSSPGQMLEDLNQIHAKEFKGAVVICKTSSPNIGLVVDMDPNQRGVDLGKLEKGTLSEEAIRTAECKGLLICADDYLPQVSAELLKRGYVIQRLEYDATHS